MRSKPKSKINNPRIQHAPHLNLPQVSGLTASDALPSAKWVKDKQIEEWRKTADVLRKRETQTIAFAHGPIAFTTFADLHLGGQGVDIERAYREASIAVKTPGMWIVTLGDLINNFILPKLVHARSSDHLTVADEWVLVRDFLELIEPKLLVSVNGNHELWTHAVAQIDMFAELLRRVKGRAIYDTSDVRFLLKVGKAQFPVRVRHKWRLKSQYNLTHSIEQASRFDRDFICGIGAHDHSSCVVREFNAHGGQGLAVMCGSYKRFDGFAIEKGFPKPNNGTAPTVIFFENGEMLGVSSVERAADLMRRFR